MGRRLRARISSRLARRLREERADQRAKVLSATLRACGLAPLMLADRERESHLALALIAVVLVTGHGSTSPPHRTGERLPTNVSTRRIHCPRRWASRTWPASLARSGTSEDTERVQNRGSPAVDSVRGRAYSLAIHTSDARGTHAVRVLGRLCGAQSPDGAGGEAILAALGWAPRRRGVIGKGQSLESTRERRPVVEGGCSP